MSFLILYLLQLTLSKIKANNHLAYQTLGKMTLFGGWCWFAWMVYGVIWYRSHLSNPSWVYWIISSLQGLLGVIDFLTGSWGKKEQHRFRNHVYTISYALLFLIPHHSSVHRMMNPWEVLVRVVLFYITLTAQVFVMICTQKNMSQTNLARECSWVLFANKWCVLALGYQWMTLVIDFSSCFSFQTYSTPNEDEVLDAQLRHHEPNQCQPNKDVPNEVIEVKSTLPAPQHLNQSKKHQTTQEPFTLTPPKKIRNFVPYARFVSTQKSEQSLPTSDLERLIQKSRHVPPLEV